MSKLQLSKPTDSPIQWTASLSQKVSDWKPISIAAIAATSGIESMIPAEAASRALFAVCSCFSSLLLPLPRNFDFWS